MTETYINLKDKKSECQPDTSTARAPKNSYLYQVSFSGAEVVPTYNGTVKDGTEGKARPNTTEKKINSSTGCGLLVLYSVL